MAISKRPSAVDAAHESAYWEARAKLMWGTSVSDVRDYLIGRRVPAEQIRVIIAAAIEDRARTMRHKGVRDILIAVLLLGGGGLWVMAWRSFVWAPATITVLGVLLLLRGAWRLLRGAKAPGSVTDSEDMLLPIEWDDWLG